MLLRQLFGSLLDLLEDEVVDNARHGRLIVEALDALYSSSCKKAKKGGLYDQRSSMSLDPSSSPNALYDSLNNTCSEVPLVLLKSF